MEQNAPGRRHFHRGRRGPDRRGPDRRAPQATPDAGARPPAEHVNVEQIMRDIRARIAQRHGIELSNQQIQELAARRLEAILDPRNVNPTLMDQLRRGAAAAPNLAPATPEPGYSFEATTIYESHRGILRFIRRLLNPILKLFFNPNPLIHTLHTQARLNMEASAREAERERLQAEWNALHYEILQRLVTEVSRVSVEMQALGLRVESLSSKVDFNDRRVRSVESAAPQTGRSQPQPRPVEPAPVTAAAGESPSPPAAPSGDGAPSEGTRRRRRRRRGRRGGGIGAPAESGTPAAAAADATDEFAADAGDAEDGEEGVAEPPAPVSVTEPAAPPPTPPETPTPPRDEPAPDADRPDPGPPDR
jgi:hypothetical protein